MIRYPVILLASLMGLQNATSQDSSVKKEPAQSAETSVSIESFIGRDVCLTAEVNLTSLDLPANQSFLEKLTGKKFPPLLASSLSDFVSALTKAGVEKGYVIATVGSLGDVFWSLQMNGTFDRTSILLVLPCRQPDQVQTALKGLAATQGLTKLSMQIRKSAAFDQDGISFVLLGNNDAVRRATGTAQPQRDAFNTARTSQDHLTHKLVFSLPTETRRDLIALWPDKMPPNSPVSISPRRMVEDISSIVVSADLPPSPALQIQIKMVSADALHRVRSTLSTSLALMGPITDKFQVVTTGNTVTIKLDTVTFTALVAMANAHALNQQKMNSLKQIGLAIHEYHAVHGHLPPRCFTDPVGKPLHSWRVAILPQINQQAIYETFNLKESWNAASNQVVATTLIPLYSNVTPGSAETTLQAPVMRGSLWARDGPPKQFRDITDGLSNTIAIIETPKSAATAWANPKPWVISAEDPMSDIFADRETANVLMLDGSVRTLDKATMTNERLKAMLTFAGGEPSDDAR